MREADGKTITPKGDLTPRIDACRGAVGTGVANAPPVAPKEPSGWLTLWALAQEIAPRTCCLTNWWQNDPPLSMAGLKRAQARLSGSDPSVRSKIDRIKGKLRPGDDEVRAVDAMWVDPVILKLQHQEMEIRTRARRHMANTLMARLSLLVRARLLAGGYEVTAKLADRTDVNLSERDLVGLEADLAHSALSGDGTVYRAVRVRRRSPDATGQDVDGEYAPNRPADSASQQIDAPARKRPWDEYKAKSLLVAQKVNKTWITPPTEADASSFLQSVFDRVPRKSLRQILHKTWPDQISRGRRRNQNTST